jgi:hypothetical protein
VEKRDREIERVSEWVREGEKMRQRREWERGKKGERWGEEM